MSREAYITGLGAFLPGDPVSSSEMEDYLGLIGEKPSRHKALVLRQNGIKTRHYAIDKNGNQLYSTAQMAAMALDDAAAKSSIDKNGITYLACASTLGDMLLPGLASHVHAESGLPPIEIANFQSVCASSIMAIKSAYLQIKAGEHNCAAVTGSEFSSRIFRPGFYGDTPPPEADFLRFMMSDGAGAFILCDKPNESGLSFRIEWIDIRSYADRFEICMKMGGIDENGRVCSWTSCDSPLDAYHRGAFILTQDFELLKRMIPTLIDHYIDLIDAKKIVIKDISHFCLHYSSRTMRERIIEAMNQADVMIDEDKWFTNLYTKGNTGAASIFIMLEELYREGNLKKGEKILCQIPESGRALNGFMLLEVV